MFTETLAAPQRAGGAAVQPAPALVLLDSLRAVEATLAAAAAALRCGPAVVALAWEPLAPTTSDWGRAGRAAAAVNARRAEQARVHAQRIAALAEEFGFADAGAAALPVDVLAGGRDGARALDAFARARGARALVVAADDGPVALGRLSRHSALPVLHVPAQAACAPDGPAVLHAGELDWTAVAGVLRGGRAVTVAVWWPQRGDLAAGAAVHALAATRRDASWKEANCLAAADALRIARGAASGASAAGLFATGHAVAATEPVPAALARAGRRLRARVVAIAADGRRPARALLRRGGPPLLVVPGRSAQAPVPARAAGALLPRARALA